MAAAKTVMGFLDVDCGPVRPPLQNLTADQQSALRIELRRIGFFDWIREPASP
jgi:N-acetylneuraminate lyase